MLDGLSELRAKGQKSQNLEAKDHVDALACQQCSVRYRDGGGGVERGLVVARVIGIRTLAAFPAQLSPAAHTPRHCITPLTAKLVCASLHHTQLTGRKRQGKMITGVSI